MPGHRTPVNARRRGLLVVGAWVAFAALAAGSFATGALVANAQPPAVADALAISSPTPTTPVSTVPVPTRRPQPTAAASPEAVRTCSVGSLAAASGMGTFQGTVRKADTGEILFDRNGATYSRTASVMKVLTSSAALAVLGPDYRVQTSVVAGDTPGTVVLVGGGDVTLASGSSNIYHDASTMGQLAEQVKAAWSADPARAGVPISTIVLDSSLFSGDPWQSSWDRIEQTDGSTAEVTALMVDGDRANPSADTSPRSTDPVSRAGQAFQSALGSIASGAKLVGGVASPGAASLGAVKSAPVSTMVQEALLRSDNTEAEMLARLTAIKLGVGNTFASLQAAIPKALNSSYGLDTSNLVIVDGSGLSNDDAVSALFLTALFDKINAREANLGVILDGLPVADQTGTLSYRFTGANSIVNGKVQAKTGSIDTANTLAGVVHAADGSTLTFAFFSLDSSIDGGRAALDALTVGIYKCGDALANG
ncbi:D-alanyl-D-alanine carboxypeptidase [Subtercola sp. PAMC28395]|uniref:D-alanyl-D-alanine carboxypeptidase/D-alanyl-D-alanine-endopeptidase n=1 Tax=Subtercola sp. PAMC28395 TaxID=2846775 RepID=UPI001C0B0015|nr:D-alanyl-D-alanine carboxypeptidase [Subtercola sp. PAMC28395]QWT24976.1 D-alanyl-D-alanine carboxypeptidase [Subtercola sp. PAMC28395]